MQQTDGGPHDDDERMPELIRPEDFLAGSYPDDARRMGIDRYTAGDAGLIALAASLDSRKPSHRVFAIVMLTLVVSSLALTLWGQFTWGH